MAARARAFQFRPDTSRTVRLLFVGDLMCMARDRVPEVDRRLRELVRSADLVIGNCEAPIARSRHRPHASYRFTFDMAEEYLETFLVRLGADPARTVLSVANNHIGDRGPRGPLETVRRLERLGVTPIGQRVTDGPIVTVRAGTVNLAIVAWTHWLNRDGIAGAGGVWRAEDVAAFPESHWGAMRERTNADCLIGAPHWGLEFHHFPNGPIRRFARRMCHAGFDLLVGHHPHVLQPVEWHGRGVCLYSVGNLNGPKSLLASWPSRLLGVFEVRLCATGSERGRIASYRLHPFVQRRLSRGVRLVPLDRMPLRQQARLERRLRLLYPSSPRASCENGTQARAIGRD